MEPLTWTGPVGTVLDPLLLVAAIAFGVSVLASIVSSFAFGGGRVHYGADGMAVATPGLPGLVNKALAYSFYALVAVVLAYLLAGIFGGAGFGGIVGAISGQFAPVWVALVETFVLSILFQRRDRHGRLRPCDVLRLHGALHRAFRHDRHA